MNKTILSLILAFGLFVCIGAVSGGSTDYADDFVKKYAGKYFNGTNMTTSGNKNASAADGIVTTFEAPASDDACAKTLNKTNEAISAFAEAAGTAKDQWSLLGSIQRLSGQKYSLSFNCKPENLKLVNVGEVGVNKTQDEACEKLIEIIQPLLNKTEDGASTDGGFKASLDLSKKALGISKQLGDKCIASMVDITQKAEEEEATEEELNEEWELLEEDDDDDVIIQIVDEEGELETIYPVPSNADVDSDVEVESVEEDKPEFLSFVQSKSTQSKTNKPSDPKPNPWADVDYKGKYAGNYTAPPSLFAF